MFTYTCHSIHFPDFAFESSLNKSTSWFSIGWIEKTAVTSLTGLCVEFSYKMSNSWKTELSLSKRTMSGARQKLWKLSGVHGEEWNAAWIHLSVDDMFEVCLGIFVAVWDIWSRYFKHEQQCQWNYRLLAFFLGVNRLKIIMQCFGKVFLTIIQCFGKVFLTIYISGDIAQHSKRRKTFSVCF